MKKAINSVEEALEIYLNAAREMQKRQNSVIQEKLIKRMILLENVKNTCMTTIV